MDRILGLGLAGSAHILAFRATDKTTTSLCASILIAPDCQPIEMSVRDWKASLGAAAIKPLTAYRTTRIGSPAITVLLEPTHEHFRAFSKLRQPGVLPLDRALFSALDDELHAAAQDDVPLATAASLVEKILAAVMPLLPHRPAPDPRVLKACEILRQDPNISLQEIADSLELSYDRASHLFTESIGLPFRSCRLWYKLRFSAWRLWCGESLTAAALAAGFADVAHLCRCYQKAFGRTPSFLVDDRAVNIRGHLTEALPHPTSAPQNSEAGVQPRRESVTLL